MSLEHFRGPAHAGSASMRPAAIHATPEPRPPLPCNACYLAACLACNWQLPGCVRPPLPPPSGVFPNNAARDAAWVARVQADPWVLNQFYQVPQLRPDYGVPYCALLTSRDFLIFSGGVRHAPVRQPLPPLLCLLCHHDAPHCALTNQLHVAM